MVPTGDGHAPRQKVAQSGQSPANGRMQHSSREAQRRHGLWGSRVIWGGAMLLAACGARSGLPWGESQPLGAAGTPSVPRDLAATCPDQPNGIYLLAWLTQEIHRFDPTTLSTEPLGSVSCGENLASMEIARNGDAYASSAVSGRLYHINIPSLTCEETPFDPTQLWGITFGLAFVFDDSPAGETLYVADRSTYGTAVWLSVLDLSTYELRQVGLFDPDNAASEITGTGDGRLYGLTNISGPNPQLRLLEVDPSTAEATPIVSLPPQGPVGPHDFTYFEGDFYFFIRELTLTPTLSDEPMGSVTTVFRYRLGNGAPESIGTIEISVLGAAVSSCAPS